MKDNKKQYWKGIEQLSNDPNFVKNAENEFPEYLPLKDQRDNSEGNSRRDFLKMMGFGIAAVSLAACEAPVRKAIPYLNKPVDLDPGINNFYASTYINGGDTCSVVVKTRDGRPIKIEGNSLSSIYKGGRFPQVEASVLSLYDKQRLQSPYKNGEVAEWADVDKEISSALQNIAQRGGNIRIVSRTISSPSTNAVINSFIERYPTTQHITYDPQSAHVLRVANERSFGKAVVPSYDFSQANVIVSFGADFLGSWISPIEYTKQYSRTRKLGKNKKTMSRHYQFEANMSTTGANADYRIPVKPSQEGLYVANLYNLIAGKAGAGSIDTSRIESTELEKAANDLWANRGKSLVVSNSSDVDVQILINGINSLLRSYESTINLYLPVNYRLGNDAQMNGFIQEVSAGKVGAVIFLNSNPVYDHPRGAELAEALEKVGLKISTSDRMDETAALTNYVAPDHHYLESWNDVEPKRGYFSLVQPTISPIFNTRQLQESLLTWAGADQTDYYTYLQNRWKNTIYGAFSGQMDFISFWDKTLHDGVLEPNEVPVATAANFGADVNTSAANISKRYSLENDEIELSLYFSVAVGDGSQANNPWLQELPDPVTKACWDNYITISKRFADELGIRTVEEATSRVNLTVNGNTYNLPVIIQPGQAYKTVGLALGYGRAKAGRVADQLGVNAYPIALVENGTINYNITNGVSLSVADEVYKVAQTQTHQTYMGRETVIQESVLDKYQQDPLAGRYMPRIHTSEGVLPPNDISLWGAHPYPNHHWVMSIDLNSCTGCNACVVACNVENNVPVVGREEVLNRREMHWLRIDRYYSSDAPVTDLKGLEQASENPEVTFQPMLCQQCSNAPCETVCPVAATTHSTEGLNQMAYSRCIGTRYCANNCPYKVRRFNWFKYHDNEKFAAVNTPMNDDLGKMVLNPDVTVRARGVMEKCTFCVQRIQAGKLTAKKERRRPKDGEITTACQTACPADAIMFGDVNDTDSQIYKLLQTEVNERAYPVLEELGTRPQVFYLTKIRNKDIEETNA